MAAIKVLIVEDKAIIAEGIAAALKKHSLEVTGICMSGEEAISHVKENTPDLILMDIELGGAMDGISTAKVLQELYPVPVIYLSDFSDAKTVDRAKKTMPANYITKPFVDADLARAIDIAFTNANATGSKEIQLSMKHVFLKENGVYIKLACHDILFLEAGRSYCKVVTEEKDYILSNSLNHVLEQLNHEDFVRAHRSHAINMTRITKLDGNTIYLGDGNKDVVMSREYRDDILSRMKFPR